MRKTTVRKNSKKSSVSRKKKTQKKVSVKKTTAPSDISTWVLRSKSGIDEGRIFPLTQGANIIGRKFSAAIPVDDSLVSREHAKVVFEKDRGFWLQDMQSTNGTYLNNKKVLRKRKLAPGYVIRVGASCFNVEKYDPKADLQIQEWGSETQFFRQDELDQELNRALEEEAPVWSKLVSGYRPRLKDIDSVRWIGLGVGVILILGAIFTQFSGI